MNKRYDNQMTKAVPSGRRVAFRVMLIIIGALLIVDTLFVMTRSSVNLGVIMPLIIGFPLFICGLLYNQLYSLYRTSLLVRLLAYAMLFVYIAFALLFAFTTSLILINSAEPIGEADALIVLGAGIRGESPTLTLKYRLDKAIEYLNENQTAIVVVSGGQGADEIVTEASVMYKYLVAHGIDSTRIFQEAASTSTAENFMFSKTIIEEQLGKEAKIAFATTRYHVFRAERVALKLGIEAQGIAAKGVWYITPNDFLRECAALVQYYITGII